MDGLIAGRYAPRGDGLAVALDVAIPGLGAEASVLSPALPGPFVVVSAFVRVNAGGSHVTDLWIVGAGGAESGPLGAGVAGTLELMPRGLRRPDGSAVVRGGVAQAVGEYTEWYPWALYEGVVGYAFLRVQNPLGLAGVRAAAALSVWPLVDVLEAGAEGARARRHPAARAAARRA